MPANTTQLRKWLTRDSLPDGFKAFILILYILPLTYTFLANTWGFQVFTLLIIAYGLYQIRLLVSRDDSGTEMKLEGI